ncbi:hypothetical protein H696_00774 [Fonticula alba]|uniref:Uncharacterized protein n=1 Tax=Fonticula alba TaxID=691883 RepID=A0A058ZH20_FONAL|nr:hypothetical protein H696_00774 [Fonticula alba]KCV73233.1 hypothetical protein H696_00774 [Fonticula alba]|eukprot:XP_009492934.1 hypothetical protein H696_00774 [Fonticula alba]
MLPFVESLQASQQHAVSAFSTASLVSHLLDNFSEETPDTIFRPSQSVLSSLSSLDPTSSSTTSHPGAEVLAGDGGGQVPNTILLTARLPPGRAVDRQLVPAPGGALFEAALASKAGLVGATSLGDQAYLTDGPEAAGRISILDSVFSAREAAKLAADLRV